VTAIWPVHNIEDDDIVVHLWRESKFWPHVKYAPGILSAFQDSQYKENLPFLIGQP
jgi:hypothetical protein